MKICSLCGTTYDGRVDFCFKDGTPLEDAPVDAVREASPFDEDLPDVGAPAAPVGGMDVPEPRNVRFDEMPEPMGLRRAGHLPNVGSDLPEPAFLRAPPKAAPTPEPEPQPFAPSPSPPLAPLSESPTIPMPMDQAQPFMDPDDAPEAPPSGAAFTEDGAGVTEDTEQVAPAFGSEASLDTEQQPASEPVDAPPEDMEATMDASGDAAAEDSPLDSDPDDEDDGLAAGVTFEDPPAWADSPSEPEEAKKGPPMGLIFGGLIGMVLIGGGGFLLSQDGGDEPEPAAPVADVKPAPEPKVDPKPAPKVQPEPEPEVVDVDPDAEPEVAEVEDGVAELEPEAQPEARPRTQPRQTDPKRVAPQPETTATIEDPWGAVAEPVAVNASLKVTTQPVGARVYIDGKDVGTSPVEFSVGQGRHRVRAELTGYEPTEIASNVDGDIGQAHVTLRKLPEAAKPVVSLFGPNGAQVFVGGKSIGVLPIQTQLPAGSHEFKVVTPDGTAYTVSGTVQESGQNRLALLPP